MNRKSHDSRSTSPENRGKRVTKPVIGRVIRCAIRVALQLGSLVIACRKAIDRFRKY